MKIKEELLKLKQVDIYSFLLFVLFKIRDVPEYSALSELSFVLDKDNLLKFCEYFGGTTITVPTIDELEQLIYALVLYQYVDIDGMEYEQAVNSICENSSELRELKSNYMKIKQILENYDFTARSK